jgi:transcriptional regulator with XRE-family HTH domain
MDVGQRIDAWCKLKSVDHHALAEMVGVTYAAVYQWVTSRTDPSLSMLEKVVGAFDLTMEEFYGPLPSKVKKARKAS